MIDVENLIGLLKRRFAPTSGKKNLPSANVDQPVADRLETDRQQLSGRARTALSKSAKNGGHCGAAVLHLRYSTIDRGSGTLTLPHQDEAEASRRRHAGIPPCATAYGQHRGRLIPTNGNDGMRAFLIVIGISLILVKVEACVRSTINAKHQRSGCLLSRVLNLRP